MADRPCKNPHCSSFGRPHPNCQCYGGYAYGGKIQHFCDRKDPHEKGCKYAKGGEAHSFSVNEENPTHYTLTHPNGDVLKIAKQGLSKELHAHIKKMPRVSHFDGGGEVARPTPTENVTPTAADMQPPANNTPVPMPAPVQSMTPEQASRGEVPVPSPTPAREVQSPLTTPAPPTVPDEQPKPRQQQMPDNMQGVNAYEQAASAKLKEAQDLHKRIFGGDGQKGLFQDFMDDKIDPNKIFGSPDSGKKIGAAIGVLLGGIGSGLTHGPNMALDTINNIIQRDIESQKANLGKKGTVLSAYLNQYGSLPAASHTYLQDAQGLVSMQIAKHQLAMQQQVMGGLGSGQALSQNTMNAMMMFMPEYGKYVQETTIPNLGQNGIRTALPISKEDRESFTKSKLLDHVLNQIEQLQAKYSGTPAGAISPEVKARADNLTANAQQLIRLVNSQGVFKKAGQEFDQKLVPDGATSLFSGWTKTPTYQSQKRFNRTEVTNAINGYMGPDRQLTEDQVFPSMDLTPTKFYATGNNQSQIGPR